MFSFKPLITMPEREDAASSSLNLLPQPHKLKSQPPFKASLRTTTCTKPFLNSPQPPNNEKHTLRAYYVAVIGDPMVSMAEVSSAHKKGKSNDENEQLNY